MGSFWAIRAGLCRPDRLYFGADTLQKDTYQIIKYGCETGETTAYVALADGGHIWPGDPQYLPSFMIGSADVNFDASEFITSAWLLRKETQ